MKAMCPHCKGTGEVDVAIAEGTTYTLECKACKRWIGGCVVGGDSPLKKLPETRPCPFCEGQTFYKRA